MTVPPMNPPDDQSGGIPQPPQPPSPPQMPPMPPMQGSPQKNDTALYALIAGILSFVLCGIFAGIPAIFLGISGKKKAEAMGGEGAGQAKAGFILGLINVVLTVVVGIIFMVMAIVGVGLFADAASKIDSRDYSYNDDFSSDDSSSNSVSRYGDDANLSDKDIVDANVEVSSDGVIDYSAYLQNNKDFATAFAVTVYCKGSEGDSDTSKVYTNKIEPGDEEKFEATIYLDFDTTSANCYVESATYD